MSSTRTNILLTGACGMLAGHLIPKLEAEQCSITLADLHSGFFGELWQKPFPLPPLSRNYRVIGVDISDEKQVSDLVSRANPDWIINCAAYTAVDESESRPDVAFAANSLGPMRLARAAAERGARLLHISTDYVFGGNHSIPGEPYGESDPPAPCGIYGHSKRLGDEFVQAVLPAKRFLIVRTSWLHGVYGSNFVSTILNAAMKGGPLKVVNDQIGCPTWAEWLAEVLLLLMARDACGIVNASCSGPTTWFDFAAEIVNQAALNVEVLPQSSAELNRPAPRPAYSALSLERLEKLLGKSCPPWQEGVKEHLAMLEGVQ